MSADDQAFLDVLSSVPNDVRKYANEITDALDKQIDHLAQTLRSNIPTSWLRTPPHHAPPTTTPQVPTLYNHLSTFTKKNRKILIGVVVFLSLTTYLIHRKRKSYGRKRRAKKASSGARVEVVIVGGSANEPVTRSLCLDLERRGFVVYVVCSCVEEEVNVRNEGRTDIRPLMLDIADPVAAKASLDRFSLFISTPQLAFPSAKPHHLHLTSLILLPPQTYPTTPISSPTLSPSIWSDLLNTRLLYPITLIHTFLPLLHHHQSNILILTPSIIPSLNPPFNAPECTVINALETYTHILTEELAASIKVTNIKMGQFDISGLVPHYYQQLSGLGGGRGVRGNFLKASSGRSSPLRELHNAVFDAMEADRGKWGFWLWGRSSVVRVGKGSGLYGVAGKVLPRGLVGWMMGLGERGRGRGRVVEGEEEYVRVEG